MIDLLEPLKSESLKDLFVKKFEELILSGKLNIGEKLPSERDLAAELGVSRPVVHEGLVELAAKGLVTIRPRSGAVINDYKRSGSLTLLSSMINYSEGSLNREFLESLLEMRMNLEMEFAHLAAERRTVLHINELKQHIERENGIDRSSIKDVVDADFDFHHIISIATGNVVYPLIINSFRPLYTNFTMQFFSGNPAVVDDVFAFHSRLADAVIKGDRRNAVKIMKAMLSHGESFLREYINKNTGTKGEQDGNSSRKVL
ncbi:MAG TPA: FadR/GntR family transcriptional regulator [Spirochaetota bacterium]|nr:FadR/GntR family transcriptional regulator [Spirochaetota bacterium]HPJ36255.1 FadR/GntR family transcriptional regulator [Spirochaetota bacterium]